MARFAKGQFVELYPTLPSSFGDSIEAGTRGMVQSIDATRSDGAIYLVRFLSNERLTGEAAWAPDETKGRLGDPVLSLGATLTLYTAILIGLVTVGGHSTALKSSGSCCL
jgi:hypothetical protein